MKLPRLFLLAALIIPLFLKAQVPQGINFQAIARDISGFPLPNTAVTVDFRIKDNGGTTVYSETHATTTDIFGLFKLIIADGTVNSGSFAAIDWGSGTHTMEVDINTVPLAVHDFESVPYALYADKANMAIGDLSDVDLTGISPGETLIWDGTNWLTGAASDSIWSQNGTAAYYNTGRVGIGVSDPLATLHLADTSNVLWGDSLSGEGFKLLWYGAKGALRFGYLNNPFGGYNYNKFWDYDSVGYYSFAAGQNSRAKGFGSFAFGSFGWADGSGSVAFFGNARGNNSFTFGGSSRGRGSITFEGVAEEEGGIAMYGYTGGRYGVSIGGGTTGLGASSSREDYAIAIGWNADARGQASIALGPADAFGYNSFATGWVTEARGNYSSTFGYRTNAYPYASMALGRYNIITGDSASWVSTDPVFIIGDGTDIARSNSFMIQKNGQTAIGYNAPTGMLQVSSALGSLNNGGTLDPTHASLLLGTTTSGLAFDANQIEVIGTGLHINYNSTHDLYLVNGGGDVAIGHAAPSTKLDVLSTGWQFRLNNDGTGGGDWFLGASNATWAAGGDKFLISPNSGSANSLLAIEAGGDVGINIENPSDRLHVYADAGQDAMRIQIGGTTAFRVHDNLGTSIGANSNPPANGLRVTGETRFDSNIYPGVDNVLELGTPTNRWDNVWATNGIIQTSDLRLKKNIEPLHYGLGTVMQLRPVSFQWREDDAESPAKIGLIAQEVQAVVPEIVHDRGDDQPMGVNYAEMVPVLIQAMQEQQTMIETQQQQIDELRRELEALKQQQDEE